VKTDSCFRCDGTGQICNICGESETACACSAADVLSHMERTGLEHFSECEDCG